MVNSTSISITPATHADRHRQGGLDPLTGDVRIDDLSKEYANGITPTNDGGWTTSIGTLGNITDGDADTTTTTGSSSISGDTEITSIDMGSLLNIESCDIIATLAAAGHASYKPVIYLDVSPDDSTWYSVCSLTSISTSATIRSSSGIPPVKIQYIRIRAVHSASTFAESYSLHAVRAR